MDKQVLCKLHSDVRSIVYISVDVGWGFTQDTLEFFPDTIMKLLGGWGAKDWLYGGEIYVKPWQFVNKLDGMIVIT